MAGWGDGYVSDVEYGRGFYREQSPTVLNLACLLNGVEPLPLDDGFAYCELGCGQGFTSLLLAAANPGSSFVAVDFNPVHIARAAAQARDAGLTNIRFIEASFQDLASEAGADLPPFDFVTLHGVYSWISPANRQALVGFLARRLKPGGVAYVSYNCMPGWTQALPLQRLLYEFATLQPDRSDRQVSRALGMVQDLAAAGAPCLADNPFLDQLRRTSDQGETIYLAHEYLNRNWQPLYHADVARDLAEAKLEFVGSANLLANFPELNFTAEQRAALDRIGHLVLRETAKDMLLNRRFRPDVFVRGARRLDERRREALLRQARLALVVPRRDVQLTIPVPTGTATLPERTYGPMLDALADRPHTVGELLELGGPRATAVETAGLLVGSEQALPVVGAAAGEPAKRFNRSVANGAEHEDMNRRLALAAPALGTGLYATAIELVAYAGLPSEPAPKAEALAQRLWQAVAARGEKLIHEGKPVESEAESLATLHGTFASILEAKGPLWRGLGVT